MNSPGITLTDWIFFISQVVLSIAGIWLGIYLYFRQQQEAQNERYREINKTLETISSQIRSLSNKFQEMRNQLDSEISEVRGQIALIEKTTSQTQSQIWLSHDKMVDKVVTQLISDRVTLSLTKYHSVQLVSPEIEIEQIHDIGK
jgi:predicted membrane chloride channel (bestrophin family)